MNFQPLLDTIGRVLTDILDFVPRLVNGLIVLLLGYIISRLVRGILGFVFRRAQLEQLFERGGISGVVKELRVPTPLTKILAQLVFYFLFLSFAVAAIQLMGLTAVAELLTNVLHFIPKAIGAGIEIVFGALFARFLGSTVTTLAEDVNISYGSILGKILEYSIIAFTVVLAISTLGLDTTILTSSLTILVASVGLGLALSFGLGSREVSLNVLAGFYAKQNFPPGQEISYSNLSGIVLSTSGAYTMLEVTEADGTSRVVSLPNALLLRKAVSGPKNNVEPSVEPEAVANQGDGSN